MIEAFAISLKLPCGAILRNRLAKAAMTEGLADEKSRATGRHVELYRRWAAGGVGLMLTGNVQVDRRFGDGLAPETKIDWNEALARQERLEEESNKIYRRALAADRSSAC